MPNSKNISLVATLQEKLEKAKSVTLANFKGLKVLQMQALKKQIKETGGEFVVAKNTLLKIAMKNLHFELPENFDLREETGILLSFKDEVSALKKLVAFAKDTNIPSLKFGFLAKSFIAKEQIIALSKIPPYETLIAKFVMQLNSPLYATVWTLKGNITKLTVALNNYQKKLATK